MPNCHYVNFDITILGNEAPYTVSAHFAGQSAEGFFAEGIDDPFWQETVELLGGVHHPLGTTGIRAAGARLFESLIAGDVQRLWIRAETVADAPAAGHGLRLRLALHPPAVAALPWEALFDAGRSHFFAASGRTPLVRMETQSRHVPTPRQDRHEPPLQVLIAAAEDAYERIDVDVERRCVAAVLNSLPPSHVQLHEMRGRFSVLDLAQTVAREKIDVLHLIGHGQPDGLLLWHNNEPAFVPAPAFCRALERASALRMVYLSACLAGRASQQASFSTVGPQLLQLGIPAVVAMQFTVTDQDAADLATMFYQELFTGPCPGAVDVAMGYARNSLYALKPDSFSFGTPVLWLNAPADVVFHFRAPAATAQTQPTPQPALTPPAPETPSSAALLAWLDEQTANVDCGKLPLNFRRSWPAALQEYRDLVDQLPSASDPLAKYHEIVKQQEKITLLKARIQTQSGLPTPPDAQD